jgi:predicted transcriptional regulator YdeE
VNGAALIVYSNYDSNYKGSYDYLLGCEVSSLSQIPKGMVGFKIPKGNYALFKTEGLFPDSMMKVWKKIWGSPMKRSYDVDYELYPEDFHATQNPHVEIHISAKG